MTYYIFIQDNKLNGCGQCKCLNEDIYNAEVTEELYNDYAENPLKYIAGTKDIEIDVPEYETKIDEEGNEYQVPVMIEIEIEVPDYDEEGNIIGYHTETREVQKTHKETVTIPYPVLNPNYEQDMAAKEAERIGNLKVTKRVFALALQQFGITYAQLKEAIAQNEQAQLEWDLCVELERKNPLLNVMAVQFDVTPAQIDYIFQKANGENV